MSKVLFFNPPIRRDIYLSANISVGAPCHPNLTLATLAGSLIKNHQVKILDLELTDHPERSLLEAMRAFSPDYVAATAVTANYLIVKGLMLTVKSEFPFVKTVIGGAHATVLPEEVASDNCFDFVVIGEGDVTLPELVVALPCDVPGIIYKDQASGKMIRTKPRELISDINSLAFPAWELFDLRRYATSRLTSRKNPAGLIETSRGCAFQCNFCSKAIFGTRFRAKSPVRVVDEMEYMLRCGFREIQIADDSFTQDISRAKEVCFEILRRKVKFSWSLLNGVRADRVDLEFFQLARKAGCWQTGFGIESGDQRVLDRINKKISLAQIESSVRLAKKAGLSTYGFFILGLSGETEDSMDHTVEFAKRLPLDIAKFDICIPLPGTAYFSELDGEGRIHSKDWARYTYYQTRDPIYTHPNVAWPALVKRYKQAYRQFYLRPRYVLSRLVRSLMNGDLPYDVYYFLKSKW